MENVQNLINIFADRLIDLMQEKSLNIKQLSIKTEIPFSTINGWTLRQSLPKADNLCVLADFFDVTIDYLLGREN